MQLQQAIFPGLEALESRYNELPESEKHISGRGFIDLMKFLRVVLLQDACVLMQDARADHPFFANELFQSFEFKVCPLKRVSTDYVFDYRSFRPSYSSLLPLIQLL